jgi:hypothetical protein
MKVMAERWSIALMVAVSLQSAVALGCDEILKPFERECVLQDRYRQVRGELLDRHGVHVERMIEYRALRFIDRSSWEKSKSQGSFDPARVYRPAPMTWEAWERGAAKLASFPPVGLDFISVEAIREIHRQSIDTGLMSMPSVLLKGAAPGRIRDRWWQLPPGFTASCDRGQITEAQARVLMAFDLKDSRGRPLVRAHLAPCRELRAWVGSPRQGHEVRPFAGSPYFFGWVAYEPSSAVPLELSVLLQETRARWRELLSGSGAAAQSPLDLIADFQRHFVAIHPFGDGNGRTSRFLQDWMLRSLDLPYVPSGDLQHDLDSAPGEYREAFARGLIHNVEFLEGCLEGYSQGKTAPECEE